MHPRRGNRTAIASLVGQCLEFLRRFLLNAGQLGDRRLHHRGRQQFGLKMLAVATEDSLTPYQLKPVQAVVGWKDRGVADQCDNRSRRDCPLCKGRRLHAG
jgi:hypothetical protein